MTDTELCYAMLADERGIRCDEPPGHAPIEHQGERYAHANLSVGAYWNLPTLDENALAHIRIMFGRDLTRPASDPAHPEYRAAIALMHIARAVLRAESFARWSEMHTLKGLLRDAYLALYPS